jgi:hypothetical protein
MVGTYRQPGKLSSSRNGNFTSVARCETARFYKIRVSQMGLGLNGGNVTVDASMTPVLFFRPEGKEFRIISTGKQEGRSSNAFTGLYDL